VDRNPLANSEAAQCGGLLETRTVRVFGQELTLEDAIEFHAFAPLEANMRVANGIRLGWPLLLPVDAVNWVQTLKVLTDVRYLAVGLGRSSAGTVRVFRQKFTLEDAIGSHACSLEANTCVTNGIPLGSSLLLPVCIVNCVQTLKATYIAKLKVHADAKQAYVTVSPSSAAAAWGAKVVVKAMIGNTTVAKTTGDPFAIITLPIPSPRLWSPETPFLYNLTVTLASSSTTMHAARFSDGNFVPPPPPPQC
jgi:hypothetical protein